MLWALLKTGIFILTQSPLHKKAALLKKPCEMVVISVADIVVTIIENDM